jgi:hypothetical protein
MTVAVISAAIGGTGHALWTGHAPRSAPWTADVISGLVVLVFACGPLYLWWILGRRQPGQGDSNDGDDGGGGGGRRRDRTPPKGSPNTDPEWWPEFERDFAAHVGPHREAGDDLTPAIPRSARLACAPIHRSRRSRDACR